jgi:hypothetical protein
MSRHIQITFDARDPRALSSFWRDVLGYVHPAPPGVDLPAGADPLAAWDDFLARAGVPEERRDTASAIEDPDGHGPRLFFQKVPEGKTAKNRVHLDVRAAPDSGGRNGWRRWRPSATGSSPWGRPAYAATNPNPRWAPASS